MTCLVLNQSKFQFEDVTEDEVLLEPLLVEAIPHTAKQNLLKFLQGRTGVKRNIGGKGRVRRRRKGRRMEYVYIYIDGQISVIHLHQ